MTQTRTLLLFAWLFLAFLVWEAWMRDSTVPTGIAGGTTEPAASTPPAQAAPSTEGMIPSADPGMTAPAVAAGDLPPPPPTAAATASAAAVTLANDVLRLQIDHRGGEIQAADLLVYGQSAAADSQPVRLLSREPDTFFVAQTGLVSATANAPSHETAFTLESDARAITLEDGRQRHELSFVWHDPDGGLGVRRIYALEDGSYQLWVREEFTNAAETAWSGQIYRQMLRVPPDVPRGGFTNPGSYSFIGAAWYSPEDKFDKKSFDDFKAEDTLGRQVTGGWLAMLQHYFMAAWIPDAEDSARFSLLKLDQPGASRYLIRQLGPPVLVPAGGQASVEARMWIGPKLQDVLSEVAPGLGLTVNYGVFTLLADPLYWLLSKLHALFGNWGWAIIGLVVLIKLAFFKLSEAQYKSFAKMRAFQPRIEALKERYGDDKQKFQQAMMELYKKEKINPMGGCLPILVQIPVFISLYWVLLESVELRHAPWIGWIQNLTAKDPYFILPALNMLTMWLTQKLTPTPGMDPVQKKMMQFMPLAFGVMFAFFPSGLVLYWTTNGALGLLQQWVITRRHGDKPGKPAVKAS